MLHKNLFVSDRLGRSNGQTPGWLRLFFVVVGLVMVSVLGTTTVNAQDAPSAVFYIALPDSPLSTAEGVLLEFDVTLVSTFGIPLTLELQGSRPGGLTFTTKRDAQGLKGKVSWTPGELDGGGEYTLTFKGTGDFVPPFPDLVETEVIVIKVAEMNSSPKWGVIGNKTVNEHNSASINQTVTFNVNATDNDIPAQTLKYTTIGLPAGATLNAVNGVLVFNWSPSESQGGKSYNIEFKVTDDKVSASQTVIITVTDINERPYIVAIEPLTVYEANNVPGNSPQAVSFKVIATDDDIPAQTLKYSGINLPHGAVFKPDTQMFSWSPTEDQGRVDPYFIRFGVIEDSDDQLSFEQIVSITVKDVNEHPKWIITLPKTVNEDNTANDNETVTFKPFAYDMDRPWQTLVYEASNLPAGADFRLATREFSWSPTEAQGGQSYYVDFMVTDDGTPPRSAVQTVQITVNEVNEKPQITTIEDKTLDEGGLLTFFVEASDPDQPAQTLSYSAENLPEGATFSESGGFSWQTTEADGGTHHDVTFIVSDGTVTASETITITVNEVNNAPVLAHIPDVVGHPGQVFFMTISATDSDFPAQKLTYSMSGALDGMWLDSATGEFSWTITGGETFVPYGVTFTVTDGGEPQQSASQTVGFTIQEENLLKNPGFQVAGKTAKQAKNWKGIGLLPGDKRVCKPSSEIIANEDICAFQFSATPAKATNRKLRQPLDSAAFTSGDHVEFSGIYEPKTLTKGAKVQLVAKLADGKTKRATVRLSTEVSGNPEILNHFEGTLTLTAAPVSLWLEISTGKSSGKLLLDDLRIVILPPSPELELADAPTTPNLIPVPAAPDLRGGAAIGMGQ